MLTRFLNPVISLALLRLPDGGTSPTDDDV
jgi:hypothetical protein